MAGGRWNVPAGLVAIHSLKLCSHWTPTAIGMVSGGKVFPQARKAINPNRCDLDKNLSFRREAATIIFLKSGTVAIVYNQCKTIPWLHYVTKPCYCFALVSAKVRTRLVPLSLLTNITAYS
eukprot:jgi/Botrbrau1/6091/Bobra.177_1s0029.1